MGRIVLDNDHADPRRLAHWNWPLVASVKASKDAKAQSARRPGSILMMRAPFTAAVHPGRDFRLPSLPPASSQ